MNDMTQQAYSIVPLCRAETSVIPQAEPRRGMSAETCVDQTYRHAPSCHHYKVCACVSPLVHFEKVSGVEWESVGEIDHVNNLERILQMSLCSGAWEACTSCGRAVSVSGVAVPDDAEQTRLQPSLRPRRVAVQLFPRPRCVFTRTPASCAAPTLRHCFHSRVDGSPAHYLGPVVALRESDEGAVLSVLTT